MIVARRSRLPNAGDPSGMIAHAGLVLDRYIGSLGDSHTGECEIYARVCASPPPSIYPFGYEHWRKQLERLPHTAFSLLHVQSRMIVGLGAESSRETGISLLHTYGVPFIPGSALKGIARHYAATGLQDVDQETANSYRNLLFGEQQSAAYLTYFDAWYVPGSAPDDRPLAEDVLTVHHPLYYRERGKDNALPTDFDDPNPVPFLTARGAYLIAVLGPDEAWAKFGLALLQRALGDWGVGAKTSSGYGRLGPTAPAQAPRFQARARLNVSSPSTPQRSTTPHRDDAAQRPRPRPEAEPVQELAPWQQQLRDANAERSHQPAKPAASQAASPGSQGMLQEVAAMPPAQVRQRINAYYQRWKLLEGPDRLTLAQAIVDRLEAAGLLKDPGFGRRAWVQELLDSLQ